MSLNLAEVIKEPLITEKTISLIKSNKYTFKVDKRATKKLIKKAVKRFFKVDVEKVWTMNMLGKVKRAGRLRRLTKKQNWKKAIVKIKKGQKIKAFEEMKK